MSQTAAGHALDRRDREQNADILTDAANVAALALREQNDKRVTFDDEVIVEADGDEWVVRVPHSFVRIKRSRYGDYPDMLAKEALEDAGLKMLAASRSTEIVWRDMRRV